MNNTKRKGAQNNTELKGKLVKIQRGPATVNGSELQKIHCE